MSLSLQYFACCTVRNLSPNYFKDTTAGDLINLICLKTNVILATYECPKHPVVIIEQIFTLENMGLETCVLVPLTLELMVNITIVMYSLSPFQTF